MKKTRTLLAALLLASFLAPAQVLVQWTFPNGTQSDSLADGGIAVNLDKAIHTEGGTSAIDFSKNGATTKSAQATGWDDGSMLKCWVVNINTQGYQDLKLSSKMQSGGNNPGPKDFMVQFRVGNNGEWTDVPGSTIVTANDWSTAALDSIPLPEACDNQVSLYLRWIMTSNTDSQGGTLSSSGINKIDDIFITGKEGNTGMASPPEKVRFRVFPNPSGGLLTVEASEPILTVRVLNSGGRRILEQEGLSETKYNLDLQMITKGMYFLKVQLADGIEKNEKLLIY